MLFRYFSEPMRRIGLEDCRRRIVRTALEAAAVTFLVFFGMGLAPAFFLPVSRGELRRA